MNKSGDKEITPHKSMVGRNFEEEKMYWYKTYCSLLHTHSPSNIDLFSMSGSTSPDIVVSFLLLVILVVVY